VAEEREYVWPCGDVVTAHRMDIRPPDCSDEQWSERPWAVPYCTEHGTECSDFGYPSVSNG
jgi:hypothetical protein